MQGDFIIALGGRTWGRSQGKLVSENRDISSDFSGKEPPGGKSTVFLLQSAMQVTLIVHSGPIFDYSCVRNVQALTYRQDMQ